MSVDEGPGELPRTEKDSEVRSDERRRIARELHDTTSQLLVALQLQLGELRRSRAALVGEPLLDEMADVIRDIQRTIREIATEPPRESEGVEETRGEIAKMFHSLGKLNRSV